MTTACIVRLVRRGDGTALIVDYKTNMQTERPAEEHRGQVELYRTW